MNVLLLSCIKATELIEKKLHFKLSVKESLQLKLHKSMCKACTSYEKHSILIDKGISNIYQSNEQTQEVDLDGLKKSIIDKIEKS